MAKRMSWAKALGATRSVGCEEVIFFIPSKDRDGRRIDQRGWMKAVLTVFGRLFRGATAHPPAQGVWRDDSRGGRLLFERTVEVVSYATTKDLDSALPHLRALAHHFGHAARQGEVGVIINNTYIPITDFDAPSGA